MRSLTHVCVQGQLAFPFVDAPEGAPPVVSRYRRRLARVAGHAYRLATIRAEARHLAEPPVRSLGAAVVPVTPESDVGAVVRPLIGEERHLVGQLARTLQRLLVRG